MKTKSLIPKSRAKTAFGLLSEIRRLILAEPKRYNQERYIARVGGRNDADEIDPEIYPKGAPACGTVGCVAGWVATLKHGDAFAYLETAGMAAASLGLTHIQAGELFGGDALDQLIGNACPQTKAYAQAGAAHIARFQKKYAQQLKATKV